MPFLAALILAPVIGGGFGELTNAILQILVFGGIAAYLLFPGRDGGTWARAPGLVPLAVLALVFVVSVIFSESVYVSLRQLLFLSACLGGYVLAASLCRDSRIAAAAVWGVVLSALIICVLGIRHYAISTGGGAEFWQSLLSTGEHMRLFGPFINPGYFAGYLVIALPITLGVYLVTRRAALVTLAGAGFVVEALALMLTGTKFGIVSAVAALFVFFVLAIGTKSLRRSRFVRLVVIAVVVLPLLLVFLGPVRTRIVAAESGGTQVHSTVFRYYTWLATANMITDNAWIGVGPGVYSIAYPRYTIAGPTKHAHQSYLQLAAESGVLALGAFVVVLLAIAYRSLASFVTWSDVGAGQAPKTAEKTWASVAEAAWKDLVPFSAWRVVTCSLFGALVGSVMRNLVDSDWYVMGIALPFWILAGVLVAQSGAARQTVALGRRTRIALASVCAVLMLLSLSFGLGDLIAPDDIEWRGYTAGKIAGHYALASTLSPLNPKYHRELGKRLAAVDPERAAKELDTAIRLAPTAGENYYVRGLVAARVTRNLRAAIGDFEKVLELNPNSTQARFDLARAYQAAGDEKGADSALQRLLAMEDSPYERIRGAPEVVDTSYAYAHAYFGRKHLSKKNYRLAMLDFTAATHRLELWRSYGQVLEAQRLAGKLSKEEERQTLELLRECYLGLSAAYEGMNDAAGARRARANATKLEAELDSEF